MGTSVTGRHDDIKFALASWAHRLGATRVRIEPRRLDKGSQKRPDLIIEIGGLCFIVDVTVVHPLAPSNVPDCARNEERVLEKAQAEKLDKYVAMAENIKGEFVAFAAETTGRLSSQALDFIKRLIQQGAKHKNVWAPREVVHGIYRTVAIAIARGNADIIASNLRSCRLADWD